MVEVSRDSVSAETIVSGAAVECSGESELQIPAQPVSPGVEFRAELSPPAHDLGLELYASLRPARRVADAFGSAALLPLLAVPFALVAIAIKIENTGPVIFLQTRLGHRGRTFRVLKFRTMRVDAENRLAQILEGDPAARREYETFRKLRPDPRLTRVGAFLRRLSLDELPQILNILIGDMSFVGPRPYLPSERPAMGRSASRILSVIPGLTGLWQISGRNHLSFEERIRLDVEYVDSYSPLRDLLILLRTFKVVWTGHGAA